MYVYKNTRSKSGFKLVAVAQHRQHPNQRDTTEYYGINTATLLWGDKNRSFNGARFGTSLLSLGRLDADIYEDFAVGAPYENLGEGAVYIYRGSKDFWNKEGENWIGNL